MPKTPEAPNSFETTPGEDPAPQDKKENDDEYGFGNKEGFPERQREKLKGTLERILDEEKAGIEADHEGVQGFDYLLHMRGGTINRDKLPSILGRLLTLADLSRISKKLREAPGDAQSFAEFLSHVLIKSLTERDFGDFVADELHRDIESISGKVHALEPANSLQYRIEHYDITDAEKEEYRNDPEFMTDEELEAAKEIILKETKELIKNYEEEYSDESLKTIIRQTMAEL